MSLKQFAVMNQLGKERNPFHFIISYDLEEVLLFPDKQCHDDTVHFSFPEKTAPSPSLSNHSATILERSPVPFETYKKMFDKIQDELREGNSWLVNLTLSTPVRIQGSLEDIYNIAQAPYKVFFRNRFVSFSPESFVRISNNRISTFPMKGTVDASLPDAELFLVQDEKEKAEHVTIVDLLRNDLSRVSNNVKVERFRYIERIKSKGKELLQTSSEIVGRLELGWQERLGDLLQMLLPAGSVTGAPKNRTLEIINNVETHKRDFYTGIAGYFDGNNLDSCVLIRYIGKDQKGFVYKSGGGITIYSDAEKEYQEMLDKIYVPIY